MEEEKKATREAFGEAIVELAGENKDVVVVNADLESSLKLDKFKEEFPERLIQVGVAEQNMASVGTGLALYGKIPFITSFAAFSPSINWNQIKLAAMSGANLKIASSHYGLAVGEDGASAQMLEDVALMRVIPEMTVISAADFYEAKAAVKYAASIDGPVYLRFTRQPLPVIFSEETKFDFGKAKILGSGDTATLVATGSMVGTALQVAEELARDSIELEVINLTTIKPLDSGTIKESLEKTGHLITLEEHQIAGGMGSAVLEDISGDYSGRSLVLGIEDKFGQSGDAVALLEHYGLDAKSISQKIQKFLS